MPTHGKQLYQAWENIVNDSNNKEKVTEERIVLDYFPVSILMLCYNLL